MARIDRTRLDVGAFSFVTVIPIRIDDVDVQGHVNNAAAAVLIQEGRANFNHAIGLAELLGDRRIVVAALSIEFAAELYYPGSVEISAGVIGIGRSSYTLGQVVSQEGQRAIYAESTLVVTDGKASSPLPERLRDRLERMRLAAGRTPGA